MPEIIARSSSSSTPAVWASATTRCSSSAVTWFFDSRSRPNSLKISALDRSSSQTNGAVIFDSQRIGRDITDRDRLGRAQRDLLGHDLTDDQRDIGREHDDEAEADGVRGLAARPSACKRSRHRLAQLRAGKSAGEDRDQGDAALHGRQEAARVGGEVERALGAAAAALGHRLQPRLARRDDRQLAHRQNAVQAAINARMRRTSSQGMGDKWSLMGGDGECNLARPPFTSSALDISSRNHR